MKKILISSFDMEVGGVERSLISLLDKLDYKKYDIDLMLYMHKGEFMPLINENVNLLKKNDIYSSFRKSIRELISEGHFIIASTRILANFISKAKGKLMGMNDCGYYQMQLMWKLALPFLDNINQEYDVAISYLWPHYFIAEKVNSKKKIAWIHTDYSAIETDIKMDLKVWNKFDYIIAVSEECKNSFLLKYPVLAPKVIVIENIRSPIFIRNMSNESIEKDIFYNDKFNLLSVARFDYAKGIDSAIKALRLLHDKGMKNIVWNVVGYGIEEEKLKRIVKENDLEDSFIFVGKKTNPYPYMKACDLYVQPSRFEGKAVTVTEAQILNKPIIITNYSTANSQIKDGYDGYICDMSIKGIAEAIELLYKNKEMRKSFINNCKNTNYSNDYELNKLYEIIES